MYKLLKNKAVIFLLMLIFLIQPISCLAETKIDYEVRNAVVDVPANKVWKINFSKSLNSGTVKIPNIKVMDDKNRSVPITITLDKKKKSISVTPKKYYEYGKKYSLIIDKKVKAKDNKTLKKPIKMEFTIEDGIEAKDVYSELPDEIGTIVIDDTLYSIDYFDKNANEYWYKDLHNSVRNTIIKKSYVVHHADKYKKADVEAKIKSNFELSSYSMGKKENGKVHQYDQIKYVGNTGKVYTYKWNEIEEKYKFVVPNLYKDVYTKDSTNKSMIKISEVQGVDGAKKFKFKDDDKVYDIGSSVVNDFNDEQEKIYIISEKDYILASGTVDTLTCDEGLEKLVLEHYGHYKKIDDKIDDEDDDNNVIRDDAYGNSPGNIINNGYVTSNNKNYIFYVNTGDGNKLYKLKTDGKFNNVITNDYAQYVNSYDGWIYYSNYDDGGKLYRVKEDGSAREKLVDDMAAYVTVYDGWIYYSNHSDGGRLYRTKVDSNGKVDTNFVKKDIDGTKHGKPITDAYKDEVAYINVLGNKIVYTNVSDEDKPYSIKDTHKSTPLTSSEVTRYKLSNEWMDAIQVDGDWIYYTSSEGDLNKARIDETEIIALKGVVRKFDKGYHLNKYGEWIYYSNALDEGKLYKINVDGSGEKVKLVDDTVTYINIVDNYLYYVSEDKLYRIQIGKIGVNDPEEITKEEPNKKITEIHDIKKIVSYDEVNDELEVLEKKYLPEKAPAIMTDNTMQQLAVDWDKKNVQKKNGSYFYKGEVIGYSKKVTLELVIPSEMLNENNTIRIYNNPDKSSDKIVVSSEYRDSLNAKPPKLNVGDKIKVYSDEYLDEKLGESTVSKIGRYNLATIKSLELDTLGKESYWITITRGEKGESMPTEIRMPDAPTIETAVDEDYKGMEVNLRDITLKDLLFSRASNQSENIDMNIDKYNIYVLGTGDKADLSSEDIISIDSVNGSKDTWNVEDLLAKEPNKNINVDSKNRTFRAGKYNTYLAAHFTGHASPDVRHGTYEEGIIVDSRPSVEGFVCSEAEIIDLAADGLPKKPQFADLKAKGGDEITLNSAPLENEIAWFIPVEQVNEQLLSWRAQEDGEWPFTSDQANSGEIGMLVGDGSENIIIAPAGQPDNEEKRYKLLITNSVGVSEVGDGTLTIDNKAPVYEVENGNDFAEGIDVGNAGKTLKVSCTNEDAYAYLVPLSDVGEYDSIYQLEEAVENSPNAIKVKVNKKEWYNDNDTKINTSRLYANFDYNNNIQNLNYNYKLVFADEVGNIAPVKVDVNIVIEASKLYTMLGEATNEIDRLDIHDPLFDEKYDKLNDKIESTEKFYNDAEEMRNCTQNEVDEKYNELKDTMIEVGANSSLYDDDEKLDAAANRLYLRYDPSTPIDKKVIVRNLQQPVSDGNISIEWDSNRSELVFDNVTGEGSIVLDRREDISVDITATLTLNGKQERKFFNYYTIPKTKGNEEVDITYPSFNASIPNGITRIEGQLVKKDQNDIVNVNVIVKGPDGMYLKIVNDSGTLKGEFNSSTVVYLSADVTWNGDMGTWNLNIPVDCNFKGGTYTIEAIANDGQYGKSTIITVIVTKI